jgi:hypothetical protein
MSIDPDSILWTEYNPGYSVLIRALNRNIYEIPDLDPLLLDRYLRCNVLDEFIVCREISRDDMKKLFSKSKLPFAHYNNLQQILDNYVLEDLEQYGFHCIMLFGALVATVNKNIETDYNTVNIIDRIDKYYKDKTKIVSEQVIQMIESSYKFYFRMMEKKGLIPRHPISNEEEKHE